MRTDEERGLRALERAVVIAGGQTAFARALNDAIGADRDGMLRQSTVWKWLRYGRPVPLDILPAIETVTGIQPREIRPDLARMFRPRKKRRVAPRTVSPYRQPPPPPPANGSDARAEV